MFLNRFSLEEKKSFLYLAHHIAHVDGEFSEKEQVIIDKYCMEMQMDDVEYNQDSFVLKECLASFEKDSHKKVVLLEIMALIFSDGEFHQSEEKVVSQMVKEFQLNPNLAIVYKEWAKSILALYIQGEALIHL
jgi:tellurite resistance protein